jgi:hypothetical protein
MPVYPGALRASDHSSRIGGIGGIAEQRASTKLTPPGLSTIDEGKTSGTRFRFRGSTGTLRTARDCH